MTVTPGGGAGGAPTNPLRGPGANPVPAPMAGRARGGTVLTTPPRQHRRGRHGPDTLGAHDMSEHKTLLQFLDGKS